MDEKIDVSVTVEQLRAAGNDASKQLLPLVKLGKYYFKKAKTTANSADFTKADAIFNAALVRSRLVNDEKSENEILQEIVEIYCEFLLSLANDVEVSCVDEIRNEIDSHKEFVANERRFFKERLDEIDSCFNKTDKTEDEYKVYLKIKVYIYLRIIRGNFSTRMYVAYQSENITTRWFRNLVIVFNLFHVAVPI
jgi:hypothetical protein